MTTNFIKVTDTHYGHNHNTHKCHEKLLKAIKEKTKELEITALIHSGDWISVNQHELPRTWAMFRKYLGDLPIFAVRGNHDLWNYEQFYDARKAHYAKHTFITIESMYEQHQKWAEEYNIKLLTPDPLIINDIAIFGFDGWYHKRGYTNDGEYMIRHVESAPTDSWLNREAYNHFMQVLENVEKEEYKDLKKMLITHMPPYSLKIRDDSREDMNANPRMMEGITENFDVFCFGHTHRPVDKIIDGCRFINAGNDYLVNHGYNHSLLKTFEL